MSDESEWMFGKRQFGDDRVRSFANAIEARVQGEDV